MVPDLLADLFSAGSIRAPARLVRLPTGQAMEPAGFAD
jgi:hypothetical protein